jgi:hypothetical protein
MAAATSRPVSLLHFSCPHSPNIILVFPLIYHDISEEIPETSRTAVTRLFQLWLVLGATLIINMVACIFILTSGSSDGGKDLGASIGCVLNTHFATISLRTLLHSYIPIIGVLSFLLWYR